MKFYVRETDQRGRADVHEDRVRDALEKLGHERGSFEKAEVLILLYDGSGEEWGRTFAKDFLREKKRRKVIVLGEPMGGGPLFPKDYPAVQTFAKEEDFLISIEH